MHTERKRVCSAGDSGLHNFSSQPPASPPHPPTVPSSRLKGMYGHQEDWLIQSVVTSVLSDTDLDRCVDTVQASTADTRTRDASCFLGRPR